ncbi:inducible alternative oxidase 2, partial [Coemansia sp. RSA 486]
MPAALTSSSLPLLRSAVGSLHPTSAVASAAIYGSRLATNSQTRSFGIKTTLKAQEYISKLVKKDKTQSKEAEDDMQIKGPSPVKDRILNEMPPELRTPIFPEPMRPDTMDHTWKTSDLESLDIGATKHRIPDLISDKIALWAVKNARKPTDIFFRNKYLHRSVMLEVVAAVPGMVGALI